MDIVTKFAKFIVGRSDLVKNGCKVSDGRSNFKVLRDLTNKLENHQMEYNNLQQMHCAFVKNKDNVIMMTRPDGSIAYISMNCKDLLGYTWQEMTTMKCSNLSESPIIHKDDIDMIKVKLEDAINGKSGSNLQYKIITKSGETRKIKHSWAPLFVDKEMYLISSVFYEIPL